MSSKARKLWTNMSKGELSPRVEGRPDLASYFEGGRTVLNWYLLRQGGLTRRPGTFFSREVRFSDKDAILLSFEFSVDDAYILEFGHLYVRFYKNDIPLESSPGMPYEIVSPYPEESLRSLHVTQSGDVMFINHPLYRQRRLSRISDTNWFITPITNRPPPSFEADVDISDDLPGTPSAVPPPVDVPPPPGGEVPPPGSTPEPPQIPVPDGGGSE